MKIELSQSDRHYSVEVNSENNEKEVYIEGETFSASLKPLDDQHHVLSVDGKKTLVTLVHRDQEILIFCDGEYYTFTTATKVSSTKRSPRATFHPPEILAPMPGKVIEIDVRIGDRVESGTVVAVLEAMKMENRLVAEGPGEIASLPVSEGQLVQGGDVIAVIDYDEEN